MAQPARKPPSARRRRAVDQSDTLSAARGERSQRERLLDAMIELAGRNGYQHVSIAQVSAKAGVSRATFYEQFDDKEDCLLAAFQTAAERLLAQAAPMSPNGDWSEMARNILLRLAQALQRDPDAGRLLFVETLAARPRAGQTQREVVGAFEQMLREFIDSTPVGAETLDVPPVALLGAIRTIVARYLRTHGEDELPSLAEHGVGWVRCYTAPPGREHWSTGPDALLPVPAEPVARPASERRQRRLPRGRHGLPAGVIARSQRTRIIYGTAEVMLAKGYESATVTDIVAAAGVSREVFYEHFTDKHNAFLEAQQHPTQHIVDVCSAAYFNVPDWPERIWNALGALLQMIAANPAISHLRLVECYAAGPEAIRRAEEITRSFTIFLEEGYSYRPQAQELPRLFSHAIAGAIFEIIQRYVARGDTDGLVRCLPQLTYLATAPFIGPAEAIENARQLSAKHVANEDKRARALKGN
jgi:AcrR family transcriptional regulator